MNTHSLPHLGIDLVRATESAAIRAGRWMGLGDPEAADQEANLALLRALNSCSLNAHIALSEKDRNQHSSSPAQGLAIGNGTGPDLDLVVDAIDGRQLLAHGQSGALSAIAAAPRGAFRTLSPAIYMEKIVVNAQVADALVPECMDAPAAWTLALIARAKQKRISDLVVFILKRIRHSDLVDEVRAAGARVVLCSDGDILGALMAVSPNGSMDLFIGTGCTLEGLIAAAAVRALGGAMLGRLSPQSQDELRAISDMGMDSRRVLTADDLVSGSNVIFAATAISDCALLDGVMYKGAKTKTSSILLCGGTSSLRTILAEHTNHPEWQLMVETHSGSGCLG